jgi:3',5'-cyclic AMP phosphodiesterase CpdA
MSLLLHLSDLHLGNAPGENVVGDYKIEAVMEADRVTRARLLRNTLKALAEHLAETGETLDGIIITGDVTTQGRRDGFKELPGLLAALGTALPDPGRIVVVPGNHDVTWEANPELANGIGSLSTASERPGGSARCSWAQTSWSPQSTARICAASSSRFPPLRRQSWNGS